MFSFVAGILCLFNMLTTMPESVIPAISMSCRSSATPKRSLKADLSACTPAPPEWISVPSISKSKRRFIRFVIPSEVEGSRCIILELAQGRPVLLTWGVPYLLCDHGYVEAEGHVCQN